MSKTSSTLVVEDLSSTAMLVQGDKAVVLKMGGNSIP